MAVLWREERAKCEKIPQTEVLNTPHTCLDSVLREPPSLYLMEGGRRMLGVPAGETLGEGPPGPAPPAEGVGDTDWAGVCCWAGGSLLGWGVSGAPSWAEADTAELISPPVVARTDSTKRIGSWYENLLLLTPETNEDTNEQWKNIAKF